MPSVMKSTKEIIQENAWSKKISFFYLKKDGSKAYYIVEPYDFTDKIFFGWDLAENKTKSFKYEQVESVVVMESFNPRFERKDNNPE